MPGIATEEKMRLVLWDPKTAKVGRPVKTYTKLTEHTGLQGGDLKAMEDRPVKGNSQFGPGNPRDTMIINYIYAIIMLALVRLPKLSNIEVGQ